MPDRFLLNLADEHKGVFSPRYRQFPAVSGGGDTLEFSYFKILVWCGKQEFRGVRSDGLGVRSEILSQTILST